MPESMRTRLDDHREIAGRVGEEAGAQADRGDNPPASAGPKTRARLKALDPNAMAFIRSSRSTSSARNDCRVGTSKALSSPEERREPMTHCDGDQVPRGEHRQDEGLGQHETTEARA